MEKHMKKYTTPSITIYESHNGLPTVLAVGAVSAALSAASVAVGKLIGDDHSRHRESHIENVED